jgi:hypothetical protein
MKIYKRIRCLYPTVDISKMFLASGTAAASQHVALVSGLHWTISQNICFEWRGVSTVRRDRHCTRWNAWRRCGNCSWQGDERLTRLATTWCKLWIFALFRELCILWAPGNTVTEWTICINWAQLNSNSCKIDDDNKAETKVADSGSKKIMTMDCAYAIKTLMQSSNPPASHWRNCSACLIT